MKAIFPLKRLSIVYHIEVSIPMKLNNVVMPGFFVGLFYYTLLIPRETCLRRTETKVVCLNYESKMEQLENSLTVTNALQVYTLRVTN